MIEKAKNKAHDLNKVASRWSKYEPSRNSTGFYNPSILRPYFIEMAYGKEFVDEYKDNPFASEDLFIKTYLQGKRVQSSLSICCGYGEIERHFVKRMNCVRHCIAVDIAPGALQAARERSTAEGLDCIQYECADLNCYPWPKEEYDLVISNGALHHLGNLESVFAGIRHTLKPGGVLYACEYVGPSYHAPRQLELINACAFLVPPELRARRGILIPLKFKRTIRFLSRIHAAANQKPQPW
jgi:SAM-dependent methyltransferase